jgi:hypothetical protein
MKFTYSNKVKLQEGLVGGFLLLLSGCGGKKDIPLKEVNVAPIAQKVVEQKDTQQRLNNVMLVRQMQKRVMDTLTPRTIDDKYSAYSVQLIANNVLRGKSCEELKDILAELYHLKIPYLINATACVLVNEDLTYAKQLLHAQLNALPLEIVQYLKKHIRLKEAHVEKECSIADWITENGNEEIVCSDEYNGCGLKLPAKGITSLYGIQYLNDFKLESAIIEASNVRYINLRSNFLLDHEHDPDFPEKPFASFSQLHDLWLDENLLTSLPADCFAGLVHLSELYLSHNQLTHLPATIFKDLTALSHLEISHNQLTHLPATIFQGLTNLLWLGLNHNQLTQLQKELFYGLNNLFLLEIAGNHLINLPSTIFHDLIGLKHLDLAHNHLDNLPENIFQKLIQLKWLDLNNNQLTHVPKTILQGLNKFESLRLSGNLLSEEQKKEIYDFCASECELIL